MVGMYSVLYGGPLNFAVDRYREHICGYPFFLTLEKAKKKEKRKNFIFEGLHITELSSHKVISNHHDKEPPVFFISVEVNHPD